MATIIVKTQAELDALPLKFEEYTRIEIHGGIKYNRIVVKVARENSSVEAWGNSSVEARENSSVEAWGNSSVVARENSSVEAWGNSSVEAWGNSSVVARGNSSVEAWGNSSVVARGNSSVVARGNSSVVAWGNSSVEAWGNSSVEARENSSVEAWGNSSVVAWGNSSVVARGNSSVEAWENSSVEAWGNSSVVAWGNSSVVARGNSSVEAWENSSVVAWGNSSVVARGNSSVVAWENSSVEAWGNSSVVARENSSVEAYEFALIAVLTATVVIKHLADYTVASLRGVKPNILKQDETATIKNTPSTCSISFETWLERGYVYADGICKKLISRKSIGDVEVFTVQEFPRKTESYVVKRGNTFSHGETVEKAIEDLRYKLVDRDTERFKEWKPETAISIDDAIQAYRAITGACEFGVREFCNSISIPSNLTVNKVIELTRDRFGSAEFKSFFQGAR